MKTHSVNYVNLSEILPKDFSDEVCETITKGVLARISIDTAAACNLYCAIITWRTLIIYLNEISTNSLDEEIRWSVKVLREVVRSLDANLDINVID